MTRFVMLAVPLLLAGCGSGSAPALGTGQPSLSTGRAALAGGSPEVALAICGAHARTESRNVPALVCQGDALTALDRSDEADAAYTAALVANRQSVGALLGLGRLRLSSDPVRAEALFLQALAQEPRNAVALNDLGIARDLQGRHAEAQDSYGAAIAADPAMRAAQVNLALSTALNGRPDAAARMLLPVAGGPDATTRERHDLAAVLAMSGHADEARELLRPDLQGADLDAALAGYRALLASPQTGADPQAIQGSKLTQ